MPSRREKRGSWNPRTRICIQGAAEKETDPKVSSSRGKRRRFIAGPIWWRRAAIVGRKTIHRVAKKKESTHRKCRRSGMCKPALQESKDARNKRSNAEGSGSGADEGGGVSPCAGSISCSEHLIAIGRVNVSARFRARCGHSSLFAQRPGVSGLGGKAVAHEATPTDSHGWLAVRPNVVVFRDSVGAY